MQFITKVILAVIDVAVWAVVLVRLASFHV